MCPSSTRSRCCLSPITGELARSACGQARRWCGWRRWCTVRVKCRVAALPRVPSAQSRTELGQRAPRFRRFVRPWCDLRRVVLRSIDCRSGRRARGGDQAAEESIEGDGSCPARASSAAEVATHDAAAAPVKSFFGSRGVLAGVAGRPRTLREGLDCVLQHPAALALGIRRRNLPALEPDRGARISLSVMSRRATTTWHRTPRRSRPGRCRRSGPASARASQPR